jgi:hypothetical protein
MMTGLAALLRFTAGPADCACAVAAMPAAAPLMTNSRRLICMKVLR